MRILKKQKKITIATNGKLRLKGGIRGPIEIPYMEDVSTIGRMVMAGYKVYEHLSNGEKVALDVHNYNQENGKGDMKVRLEIVKSADELKTTQKDPNKPSVVSSGSTRNIVPKVDIYTKKE